MKRAGSGIVDPPKTSPVPPPPPQPPVLRHSSRQQQATDPLSPKELAKAQSAALRAASPVTPQVNVWHVLKFGCCFTA